MNLLKIILIALIIIATSYKLNANELLSSNIIKKESISTNEKTPNSIERTIHVDSESLGKKIMQNVYDQVKKYKAQTFDVSMTIVNKDNKERKRNFELKKLHVDDNSKSLIKFSKPASIKGTKLLTHSLNGNDTYQWLYIPAFKSIKQIFSADKNKSFMGSDFSYSDIAGRLLNQDKHILVKEDDKYFYITSYPRDENDIYEKLNLIISRDHNVILKIDFYKEGVLYKKLVNKKIQNFSDMYIATHSVMYNYASKGKSQIIINNLELNKKIAKTELEIKSLY